MTFCRSIYVKKVMKLLAFIFEQPSYSHFALNIYMKICVPLNIDLICGLVLIFFCGLLSVPDDTNNTCYRHKSVHLVFTSNIVYLLRQFGMVKTSSVQNLLIADSCLTIHSNA